MSDQIMFDSDKAATYRTDIKGWVSKNGQFYGDGEHGERAARYDGCTHQACEGCGRPSIKPYGRCIDCRNKQDTDRYNALEFKEWDKKTPLYSYYLREYIWDLEQLLDDGEDVDFSILDLVICEPRKLSMVEEDHWEGDLPEDYDLPDDVAEALTIFNEVLKDAGTVSWWPGKYRTNIKVKS